jgi:hypothetical protein
VLGPEQNKGQSNLPSKGYCSITKNQGPKVYVVQPSVSAQGSLCSDPGFKDFQKKITPQPLPVVHVEEFFPEFVALNLHFCGRNPPELRFVERALSKLACVLWPMSPYPLTLRNRAPFFEHPPLPGHTQVPA